MDVLSELRSAQTQVWSTVGQAVTFRGLPITICPINESPGTRDKRQYQFDDSVSSIVFLPLTTDPKPSPALNESILDEFGKYHRISKVTPTSLFYVCGCVVSKP
jgi:hypothetical protein